MSGYRPVRRVSLSCENARRGWLLHESARCARHPLSTASNACRTYAKASSACLSLTKAPNARHFFSKALNASLAPAFAQLTEGRKARRTLSTRFRARWTLPSRSHARRTSSELVRTWWTSSAVSPPQFAAPSRLTPPRLPPDGSRGDVEGLSPSPSLRACAVLAGVALRKKHPHLRRGCMGGASRDV